MIGSGAKDDGFTLPELLLSMLLFGVIIGAFGSMLIVVLHSAESTRARTDRARTEELTALYLTSDINSSKTVSTADTICAGGNQVRLNVKWPDVEGTEHVVDYVTTSPVIIDGVSSASLRRRTCVKRSGDSAYVLSENALLSSTVSGIATWAGAGAPTCSGSPCSTTPTSPTTVTLKVPEISGPTSFTANRRSSS